MKYTIFTLCSNNYLAQAIVLGKSLRRSNPRWNYIIGLVDKKEVSIDYDSIGFDIIEVASLNVPFIEDMVQRYSVVELNTALKPFFFQYLFNRSIEGDVVAYLDPDIYVYQPLSELESKLISNDIVLIPHCQSPIPDDGMLPAEEDILNTGIYNLGFIAVKKSPQGQAMIQWWKERLTTKAYIDFSRGLFTDQIWQNLVPIYYSSTAILQDIGYDVAYWNLHERSVLFQDNQWIVANTQQKRLLVFFHFSGYSPKEMDKLSKYQTRFSLQQKGKLSELFRDYANNLLENGYLNYIHYKCYYSTQHDEYLKILRQSQLSQLNICQRYIRVLLLMLRRKINQGIMLIEKRMSKQQSYTY